MRHPLFLCLLVGCAEFGVDEARNLNDTAMNVPAEWGGDQVLRLDVFAASGADDRILNQSFLLANGVAEDLSLSLATPVSLEGTVTGRTSTPYPADVDVPGTDGPVDTIVRASVPGTIMSYSTLTDEDGTFSTPIVPSTDYTVSYVPTTNTRLPFLVQTGLTLSGEGELSATLSIEDSIPVYGRIFDGLGSPISELAVQLKERSTGIAGPSVVTDQYGVYNLRAYPGDYLVSVEGDPQRGIPSYLTNLSLWPDALTGQEVAQIDYGHIDLATVSGEITGESGPVGEVLVRIRSNDILDSPRATVLSEATTGSNGRFSIRVAPGNYEIEYLPSHEGVHSPMALGDEVTLEAGFSELPLVVLKQRPNVNVQVLDALGNPLSGAIVRAKELSFGGETFETYSGPAGTFTMDVSEAPLQWTVIPPDPSLGAVTFVEAWPQDLDGGILQAAAGVKLSGCVSAQGEALPFTLVEVRDQEEQLYGTTFTDPTGCFYLGVDWHADRADTGY